MNDVTKVRARHSIKSLVRIVGILMVLLGAFNLLVAPALLLEPIAPYRQGLPIMVSDTGGGYYLGDIALIAVGAILASFV